MKEGGGGDHVSVGVKLPRSRGVTPVSNRDLYRRPPGKYFLVNAALVVLIIFLFSCI